MSDEASIAASTLLSSLLGATASTMAPQDGGMSLSLNRDLQQNSGAFGQILATNFDETIASGTANATPYDGNPLLRQQTTLNEPVPNSGESPATQAWRAMLSTNLAESKPEAATGQPSPPSGIVLPIPTLSALPTQAAEQPLLAESDGVDKLALAADQTQSDIDTTIDEELDASFETGGTQALEAIAAAAGTQVAPTATPAVAGSVLPTAHSAQLEAQTTRATEPPSTATTNVTPPSGEMATSAQSDTDHSFSQNQPPAQNSTELPVDVAEKQRSTAEFSVDHQDTSDLLHSNPGTAARSGDPGVSALSLLNGSATSLASSTSGAVPSAALALAADRNLAGSQIAQTLSGFIRQGDDKAEINLTPPHLGKISVRIALQNDQVSVVVTSPMADVREAIEASLPQLDELLSEAGLSLADASVADQGNSETDNTASANGGTTSSGKDDGDTEASALPERIQSRLLDAYA